uniref:nuclear transport factor 2 family protein n=1 Tax=Parerythrobacter lutipelagi TaxID=1964208 RepID=UPI0010F6E30D|nr:nuclear transport factor 2 family protein [Parerythrobacter lutipelagi]
MIDAHAFFGALRSSDKTALANHMVPEATIFVHNRMDPDAPRLDIVPVTDHLQRWLSSPPDVVEWVHFETILVDGDMAQVWGPYYFTVAKKLSHCGINSLSMVKTDEGWKVANTSFTMEAPENCDGIVKKVQSTFVRTEADPR